MPDLHLDDPNDEGKLLEYLKRYRARSGHRLTVIFDAGLTYHPAKSRKKGGITIQFAPHGKTADQLIKQRLRKVQNPQAMTVVSSDQAVQQAARQAQVRIVSSQQFAQELLDLSAPAAEDNRTHLKLSEDEVEAWLKIFKDYGKT